MLPPRIADLPADTGSPASACDGASTPAQIAAAATLTIKRPVSEELVHFTLTELRRDNLLQADEALPLLPVIERRELLRRLGMAAVVLPMIAMVSTPVAAQAYSGGVYGNSRPGRQANQAKPAPEPTHDY